MTLKSDVKLDEKFDKNKEFVKLNASSGQPENVHFDVLLLSKVYYV